MASRRTVRLGTRSPPLPCRRWLAQETTASSRSWRSPHDREILRLALPALGALVAEPLFLLADTAIVGHLGTSSLAALGVAAAALTTVVNLCVFLAYGTTAAVARQLGAGDLRTALAQGIDGLWLAALIGVAAAAATALLTPQIVDALGASEVGDAARADVPPDLRRGHPCDVDRARRHRRPSRLAGHPYAAGGVRAGAVGNVGLNLVLVYGAGLGIAGSALGTVITQWAMAAVLAGVVVRGARHAPASLRPDRRGILAAAHAGVPLIVRTLTLRAALLATTYVATQQGDVLGGRAPGRIHALDVPRVRARRDRDRRPGDHRSGARRIRHRQHADGDPADDHLGAGHRRASPESSWRPVARC